MNTAVRPSMTARFTSSHASSVSASPIVKTFSIAYCASGSPACSMQPGRMPSRRIKSLTCSASAIPLRYARNAGVFPPIINLRRIRSGLMSARNTLLRRTSFSASDPLTFSALSRSGSTASSRSTARKPGTPRSVSSNSNSPSCLSNLKKRRIRSSIFSILPGRPFFLITGSASAAYRKQNRSHAAQGLRFTV